MDNFEVYGSWWIPGGAPTTGKLSFSEKGPVLTLYGALLSQEVPGGELSGPAEWGTLPLIHGRDEQQRSITLLGAFGMTSQWPEITEQTFDAELAVIGDHLMDADFSGIRSDFDYLADWVGAPPVSKRQKEPRATLIDDKIAECVSTTWGDASLAIRSGVIGSSDEAHVSVRRWCAFSAESGSPQRWSELLESYLRPFHDLLLLSLGRELRMRDVELRPEGSEEWMSAYFRTLAPGSVVESSISSYRAPTLLTAEDSPVPLSELLPRWFDLYQDRQTVIALLHAPLYAPFTYSAHRYASFFQILEAYHRVKKNEFGSKDVSKQEHGARVKLVVSALDAAGLPQDHVQWTKNVIQGRNDKSLKEQIVDVVSSTGKLGQIILAAVPDFPTLVYNARTGVSHGGADKGPSATQRYWCGEVLLWLMRVRLLQDLGITDSDARALRNTRFQDSLKQLSIGM
ncbi:HEPN domain-containing protein [Streptomyces anulatus]|uniref:ApeA N-terminal domain 1-containing protein n=1 Tax=Streptomyces anulatus TaxID=1892 RepID=UPI0012FF3568|nr:HEPN domain-containing protein [Streptomyces anulatus]